MNNAYWLLFLVLFEMCPGIGGKTSDEKSVVLSAKEIHRFQAGGSGAFYDVGFSRNGAFLGAGSHKGKVVVWDMAKGSEILGIEAGKKVTSVAFHPSKDELIATVTGVTESSIKAWGIPRGKELFSAGTSHSNMAVYSPSGKMIVATDGPGRIGVRDSESGKQLRAARVPSFFVECISISPDSSVIATSSLDKKIRIWRVDTLELIHVLEGHTSGIPYVAFHPMGEFLISASRDKSVRVWNVKSGKTERSILFDELAVCAAASPNGKLLAVGIVKETASISIRTFQTGRELLLLKDVGDVRRIAWSPDGRFLAHVGGQNVRVWQIEQASKAK